MSGGCFLRGSPWLLSIVMVCDGACERLAVQAWSHNFSAAAVSPSGPEGTGLGESAKVAVEKRVGLFADRVVEVVPVEVD